MHWEPIISIISLFVANSALIMWFRTESRSDWHQLNNRLSNELRHLDNRLFSALQGIRVEMKDFHERLLKIEESKNNK